MVFAPGPSARFLLDGFQIPPFLLPIYQAAGIEYNVPWQVLAAINWIETDYGRNLNVSSAGAVGWMQFLPSTWKEWGVDATGSGYADPYNPTDAIFTAARYLQAAGASKNLAKSIYAYNHATWYVQSVLLRTRLIDTVPQSMIQALSQLVSGRFPITTPSHYRDQNRAWTDVYAAPGAPVVAANDGIVERIGRSAELGRYVVLRDAFGNTYTYADLGTVSEAYALPKPDAVGVRRSLRVLAPNGQKPGRPATAGAQLKNDLQWGDGFRHGATRHRSTALQKTAVRQKHRVAATSRRVPAEFDPGQPMVKERLFARPWRPASFNAGGDGQVSAGQFSQYVSDSLHLARGQYVLRPLRPGVTVMAGTILGHLARTGASRLRLAIRPAGHRNSAIDPKPILDAWKLLTATGIYRHTSVNPAFGPGAANPVAGEIMLASQHQLAREILNDRRIDLQSCERDMIARGLVSARMLAAVDYLVTSGLSPTVSDFSCSQPPATQGASSTAASAASGDQSVYISAFNGVPVAGHQGAGSITDVAIRSLLSLSGAYRPASIVSLMSYPGQANTVRLPDHADHIQLTYGPLARSDRSGPTGHQWSRMMRQLDSLPEPGVPFAVSSAAIKL